METIGVIAEYNPFHNGHKYMLQQLRQQYPDSAVIVVMSGSFTQRGEAACLDKWQRAACAVQNGASLVLELPFVFAVRSAQYFAEGAVQLLNRLNMVNYLAFGAETADLRLLTQLAETDNEAVSPALRAKLKQGFSYASALGQVLSETVTGGGEAIRQPNNILAVEYLRALRKFSAPLQPVLVQREAAPYHSQHINGTIASAQAIRKALQKKAGLGEALHAVPKATASALDAALATGLPEENTLLRPLLCSLRLRTESELQEIYGVQEGLENVLRQGAAVADLTTLDQLCLQLKSKRYSYTRLKRSLLYILLHLTKKEIELFTNSGPLYARILAFNSAGKKIIAQLKKSSDLPLVNRPAKLFKAGSLQDSLPANMLGWDCKATELRNLCLPTVPALAQDLTQPPIFIDG